MSSMSSILTAGSDTQDYIMGLMPVRIGDTLYRVDRENIKSGVETLVVSSIVINHDGIWLMYDDKGGCICSFNDFLRCTAYKNRYYVFSTIDAANASLRGLSGKSE